jgi:mRNA-degrading endonuclease RelE of RelBE toxin-antitoxin system
MIIVETSVFTRQVQKLLSDDEYRQLQIELANYPAAGVIIQGSGGIRKMRWSIGKRGKRGGVRILYYWAVQQDRLLMLFVYSKSNQDDLSLDQIKILQKIVEEEYG